jgi:hypothetical protein
VEESLYEGLNTQKVCVHDCLIAWETDWDRGERTPENYWMAAECVDERLPEW